MHAYATGRSGAGFRRTVRGLDMPATGLLGGGTRASITARFIIRQPRRRSVAFYVRSLSGWRSGSMRLSMQES